MLRRLFCVLAGLLVPLWALPSSAALPVLVIYPFAVSGTAPDDLGIRLANQIAAEITALGGVTVVRGAPGLKPAEYRVAARSAGADVYFSGSIVPVFGTSFSVIEQLVSTQTGLVEWSVTTHFRTLDDVSGEGSRVRDELLHNVATPAPSTTPAASLISAGNAFAVLPVTGSAGDDDRKFAMSAIVQTLQRRGFTAVTLTGAGALDPAVDGLEECNTTNAQTLIVAALDTSRVDSTAAAPQTTAHIALRRYDCHSHTFAAQATVVNHIAPLPNDAIAGAIEDAVSAFPAPS